MYREKKEKNKKFSSFSSFENIYKKLKKEYNISDEDLKKFYKVKQFLDKLTPEIIKDLEKKEIEIPIVIFSKKLSCLESVVKYLRENFELSNKEIGKLTKRSEKTIWQAYNSGRRKSSLKFKVKFSKYYIPVNVLSDRKLSVLESIVKYLRENFDLSFSEIGRLLYRDSRTIWTVYSRARKKYGK